MVVAVGMALTTTAAFALLIPSLFPPRMFQTQQVHYIRISANFNNMNNIPCVIPSAGSSCTVRVGALPYNAFILRAYQQVEVAFNSGTTDTLQLGISQANANELVAAQSVHAAGNMAALTVVVASGGVGNTAGASPGITGFNAVANGADGGFDLWIKYVQTGAVPTAGSATIVIEYIAPNDGSCLQNVPFGGTSPAC
jgi:hypothetical protein